MTLRSPTGRGDHLKSGESAGSIPAGGTHEQLVARLERERISYPDELEAERYAPKVVERVAGRQPAYTPIGPRQAAANFSVLKRIVDGLEGE